MTRKTTDDPELQAKITLQQVLDDLSDDECRRVVRWVIDRWADAATTPRASWDGGQHQTLPFDPGVQDGRGAGVEP